jgi:hypothetical protein
MSAAAAAASSPLPEVNLVEVEKAVRASIASLSATKVQHDFATAVLDCMFDTKDEKAQRVAKVAHCKRGMDWMLARIIGEVMRHWPGVRIACFAPEKRAASSLVEEVKSYIASIDSESIIVKLNQEGLWISNKSRFGSFPLGVTGLRGSVADVVFTPYAECATMEFIDHILTPLLGLHGRCVAASPASALASPTG